jgi:hypothetical protein
MLLVLAALCASLSVFIVGVQLMQSGGDTSFALQAIFLIAALSGLIIAARKVRLSRLALICVATAGVYALAPLDLSLSEAGLFPSKFVPLEEGALVPDDRVTQKYREALLLLFITHFACHFLSVVFTRQFFIKRRSTRTEPAGNLSH